MQPGSQKSLTTAYKLITHNSKLITQLPLTSSADTKIPLHSLIAMLRREGYEVGTSAMLDLQRIVANINEEDVQSPGDLKYLLGPIICRNKEEQQKFYKLFNEYISTISDEEIAIEPAIEEEKPIKKRLPIWWVIVPVAAAAIAWFIYQAFKENKAVTKGIVEYGFMNSKMIGDTVKLKVEYSDSLNSKDYRTDWQVKGPNKFATSFKNSGEIAVVFDSAGSYTALASTYNKSGSLLKTDSSIVDILCENPPSVSILGSATDSTDGSFTATIDSKNPSDPAYKYHWYVNDAPVQGDSTMTTNLLKANQPNIIRVKVDWPGANLHCSGIDSLTDELNLQPPIQLTVINDPKAPISPTSKYNWSNILLSVSGLLLLPLVTAGLVRWRLKKKKGIPHTEEEAPKPVEKEKDYKGPFTIEFNSQQNKIIPEAGISQLAEVLRKRHTSDVFRLSINKTINSTIRKGGFPVLEYVPRTQPADFLILIDKEFPDGHLTRLFTYVIERLKKEQVHLTVYSFSREPLLLSNENLNHILLPIDKVARLYPETMLLIFSQADAFFRSYDVLLKKWVTEKFKSWNSKLIITPAAKKDWGAKELALYDAGFTVVPADINAHSIISDEINHMIDRQLLKKEIVPELYSSKQFNFSRWRQVASYLKAAVKENNDRFNHVADQNLLEQWLCALAVYPHINWDVTIAIGKAFEEKYSRPGQLVNYTNLLTLSRIQWMNDEQLMDSLRIEMMNHLEEDKQVLARQVILELMKEIEPKISDDSLVKDELQFLGTTNKFLLNANDKISQELTEEELEQFKDYLKNDHVDWALQTYLEGTNTLLKDPANPAQNVGLNEYIKKQEEVGPATKHAEKLKPVRNVKDMLRRIAPAAAFIGIALISYVILSQTGKLKLAGQQLVDVTFDLSGENAQDNLQVNSLSVLVNQKTFPATAAGNGSFIVKRIPVADSTATLQVSVNGGEYRKSFPLKNSRYTYLLIPGSVDSSARNETFDGTWKDSSGLYYLVITQKAKTLIVESYSTEGVKTNEGKGSVTGKNLNFKIDIEYLGTITANVRLADNNTLQGTLLIENDEAGYSDPLSKNRRKESRYSEPITLKRVNGQLPNEINEIWDVNDVFKIVAFYIKPKLFFYADRGRVPAAQVQVVETSTIDPNTYKIILQPSAGMYEVIFVRNVTATSMEWLRCRSNTFKDVASARKATYIGCGEFTRSKVSYAPVARYTAASTNFKIEFPLNNVNLYATEVQKFQVAQKKYASLSEDDKRACTVSISLNGFYKFDRDVQQRQLAIRRSVVGTVFSKAKWLYKPYSGNAFQRDFVEIKFASTIPASIQPDCNRTFRSIKEALSVDPSVVCKLDLSGQSLYNLPKEIYSFTNLQELNVSDNKIPDDEIKNLLSRFPKARIINNSTKLTPSQEKINLKVTQIVAKQLGVNLNEITLKTRLVEDLGADDLDIVELVMEFEKEFNFSMPDAAAKDIKTVEQAVLYIDKATAPKSKSNKYK
jgi:acyl carrier protein